MAKKATFGLVRSEGQAERIIAELRSAGFSGNDISVLFPDKSGTRDFALEKNTKAPEGAVTGAGAGGVLGGTLGLLAGIGTLAIPGLGPFIAAGPLLAALSGAAAGATVGGVAGALIGLGIPELEAKRYAGKIEEGGVLVSVHVENRDEARRAKAVLEQAGATDIVSASATYRRSAAHRSCAELGLGRGGRSAAGCRAPTIHESHTPKRPCAPSRRRATPAAAAAQQLPRAALRAGLPLQARASQAWALLFLGPAQGSHSPA